MPVGSVPGQSTRKAKRLEHAFGVPVPDEVFERLTEEMACAEQAVKEAMPRGE